MSDDYWDQKQTDEIVYDYLDLFACSKLTKMFKIIYPSRL